MVMNSAQSYLQKFRSQGIISRVIIICVAIFLLQLISRIGFLLFNYKDPLAEVLRNYFMVPSDFARLLWKPWTLFTYAFVHLSFFHLLMNMLVLHWISQIFQNFLGEGKTFPIFILGAIFGALFYIVIYSVFPYYESIRTSSYAMGASAGVMAMVFATARLVPDYPLQLILIGEVKLKYIAGLYFVLDLVGITGNNSGGALAHIGGAIFGFFIIQQLQIGNDWIERGSKLFKKKKKKMHIVKQAEMGNQEKIDAILDKISAGGYDSLSAIEKDFLFKHSKK